MTGHELSPILKRPIPLPGVNPTIWEAHAIATVRESGCRLSISWRSIAKRAGWWLADDGVLHREHVGPLGALSAGACFACTVPSEPGSLTWAVYAPVSGWSDEDDDDEDEEEEARSTLVTQLIGYIEIPLLGRARLRLKREDLKAATDAWENAGLEASGEHHLPAEALDGVRRLVAAILASTGAQPDARDLGWLRLTAQEGCLSLDDGTLPRCLIPGFDGAVFSLEWRDALWARFSTGAPVRLRQSVERYSIVKRA
jgi:hypothetical protein